MKDYHWILPERANQEATERLALDLKIPPAIAGLLHRRGIYGEEATAEFLSPKLKTLSDPLLLPNMAEAVERIRAGLHRKERIVLYGDYDVDGVTSLALFARVLKSLGGTPVCFLPSRMDEGYGLSPDAVNRCIAECNPELLIAVDCGTSSVVEIADLQSRGVDVVVFDHHEIKAATPRCILVNPKLGDSFHYLCSVGIVFKACHALLRGEPERPFDLREALDLVALGTVADIVPLVDENRLLVRKGLEQMAQTRWAGLRALMDAVGVPVPVRPSNVGFQLGPRLNASGRLGTAQESLELLLTDDIQRANGIAAGLDRQNRERQTVEQQAVRDAEQLVASEFDAGRDSAIVAGGDGWHQGVVGIVAARLSRAYHRPCFVIGFDEEGIGKGSGRSIEGFSLVHALTACGTMLEKYGGHEMAAGLTVLRDQYPAFRDAFLAFARETISADQLRPRLRLDGEIGLADVNFDFLAHHDELQPFGTGNPQPLFLARRVTLSSQPVVLKQKHLRLDLLQNGVRQQAIWFNGAVNELPPPPWDVAFEIERNEYNGNVRVQMQVRAVRASAA